MKKSIISTVTALSILTSVSAYAIGFEQIGDKTVCLYGNAEARDERVALDVFVNGKTRADLPVIKDNGGKYTDIWVTHLQTTSNENGDYRFEFDVALPSGKYVAYTGIKEKEFEPYTFVFVSKSDFVKIAEEINTASAERIQEMINDTGECYVIGISEEEAAAVNSSELAKVLKNTLRTSPFDKNDRVKSWGITDKAYFVEELNEGKITDIYKVDKNISDFADSDIAAYYKKDNLSGTFIADFTKRMSGRGLESYNDYKTSLPEAFVLATVKNPSGAGEVEKIVTAFQKEIGVSVTSATPTGVWNKLAGKDYADFAALTAAFNSYAKEDTGTTKDDSHRRGGTSGSVRASTYVPIAENDGNSTQTPSIPINIFNDIEDVEWAKDAIVALAERNIVSGTEKGKFNPNGNVTREQFAKIVARAFIPETEVSDVPFKDVPKDAWYYEYIARAYKKGIVSGIEDNRFGVGMDITRQDMCVMIYRAAQAAGMKFEISEEAFTDDNSIADYAKEAVYALKATGAVNGINDDEFGPQESATWAQAAKIIYALIK